MDENKIMRRILDKVVKEEPRVTAHGLGVNDGRKFSPGEREERFRKEREDLFERTRSFKLACMWLSLQERTKNVNPDAGTSYRLKHEVESWAKETFEGANNGVPNGSLIAAAIHLGFKYEPTDEDSPNVFLNISKNRVKRKIV